MKEMQYQTTRIREVLDEGNYKGFNYYILSLGTHPTAYVEIPKEHKCFQKHYDECNVDCHGGLTFSNDTLWAGDDEKKGWFIGWDYAHYGDYVAMHYSFNDETDKKWNTAEILEEVKNVIEQL